MQYFVFDACAFIAYFNNEEGAERVKNLLDLALLEEIKIFSSVINVYEVYYDCLKRGSEEKAEKLLEDIFQLPINIENEISKDIIMIAGKLKVKYSISVADSFALALSKINHAQIVTTDHHEFDVIESEGEISFFWIR